MLRAEAVVRPIASGLQMNSQKVPYLTVVTIADHPGQIAVAVSHRNSPSRANRHITLKINAARGDILQVRKPPARVSGGIFPNQLNQFCTE
jgi:hypothetical protein